MNKILSILAATFAATSAMAVTGSVFTIPNQDMGFAPQYQFNNSQFSWFFRQSTVSTAAHYPSACNNANVDALHVEFDVENWDGAWRDNVQTFHAGVALRTNRSAISPANPFATGYTTPPNRVTVNGIASDGVPVDFGAWDSGWARVNTGVGVAFGHVDDSMPAHIVVESFNKQIKGLGPLATVNSGPWWPLINWLPATYRVYITAWTSKNGTFLPGWGSHTVVGYAVDYKNPGGPLQPWLGITYTEDSQIKNTANPNAAHVDAPHVYGKDVDFLLTLPLGTTTFNSPIKYTNISGQWTC